MALYISREEHEEGHDYEFEYGEILDITDVHVDENDDMLEFRINDSTSCVPYQSIAYCPYGVFDDYFEELNTDGAWLMFREDADEDCYTTENAYTFEDVQTYSPTELMYLSDIKYLKDEDLLSGFDEHGREVVVPRCAVVFHSYE